MYIVVFGRKIAFSGPFHILVLSQNSSIFNAKICAIFAPSPLPQCLILNPLAKYKWKYFSSVLKVPLKSFVPHFVQSVGYRTEESEELSRKYCIFYNILLTFIVFKKPFDIIKMKNCYPSPLLSFGPSDNQAKGVLDQKGDEGDHGRCAG